MVVAELCGTMRCETPNVHFVYFDTGSIPVVIGLSNIANVPSLDDKKSVTAEHSGPASGYVAYCEGGRFEGQRGRGAASIKTVSRCVFKGNSGMGIHQQNFIDAVVVATLRRSMPKFKLDMIRPVGAISPTLRFWLVNLIRLAKPSS